MQIEALEDCELVCISYSELQKLRQVLSKADRLSRILSQMECDYLSTRLLQYNTLSARERFEDFL
jgi:hypothetical protein